MVKPHRVHRIYINAYSCSADSIQVIDPADLMVAAATVDIVATLPPFTITAPAFYLATGALAGLADSLISSTEVWPIRG